MAQKRFKAMLVEETEDKQFTRKITEKSLDDLPEGDLLIRVKYSSLVGIDSQNYPKGPRQEIWNKLAGEWRPDILDEISTQVSLEELDEKIEQILKGKIRGRTVVCL